MPYDIIDFHAHIFPKKIVEKAVKAIGDFYDIPMRSGGQAEELLEKGRPIGVKYYVVHSVATVPAQVVSINNFIHEQMQLHPEFMGFATLHPYMEDLEKEIDRAEELGLRGIKIHPDFQKFHLDDPKSVYMFKRIGNRFPVLIHTGDARYDFSNPRRMARVLDQVPDVVVIGAHFGGYSEWSESEKWLLGRDLYIDTSSTLFAVEPEKAVEMIHRHGVARTLFGTDYPMWDHREELARFLALPLSEQERKAILYDNAAKLLGLS